MKENSPKKMTLAFVIAVLVLVISVGLSHTVTANQHRQSTVQSTKSSTEQTTEESTEQTTEESTTQTTSEKTVAKAVTSTKDSSENLEPIVDWRNPSEKKAYPTLQEGDWIDVSLTKQRVKIMREDQVLYTMICSTGSGGDRATPTGTYAIQGERGETFFNQSSGEGANYWVSWKDHGIYLFHSVPIDSSGNYIEKEAEELGKKANSHGCIRLTVADAKWFYEHALYGMKVVIHK
jgi:lipoprotein-anchoring transpeptidase ErfK/SrfK